MLNGKGRSLSRENFLISSCQTTSAPSLCSARPTLGQLGVDALHFVAVEGFAEGDVDLDAHLHE